MIQNNSSETEAVETIDKMLNMVKEKSEVFNCIVIDNCTHIEGFKAIRISPEINNYESSKVGSAMKEFLIISQKELKNVTPNFIDDFKSKVDTNYINEMEKIGINFHIIQLKAI
jgi:hypothetical protein